MSSKTKVAVLKTSPDKVIDDYIRAGQVAGLKDSLVADNTTILKDNISWHLPFPGANSVPWQVEGTIKALKKAGITDIVAVHNDTVVTNPYTGGKLLKLKPVYEKYSIPERYNNDPSDLKWIEYKPKAKMLVLDKIFSRGIKIPEFFIGKNIVHLPTVKTHIYTTTTGAMKNAFGGLLNTKRHYTHSVIHETLVDLLQIQKEIHSGIFCFMDGTTAGSGPGPRTMTPHKKDIILASADQVAIDAVATKIMGFEPMSIKYIRMGHDAGLGCGDVSQIEIIGEDISKMNFGFSVGDNMASKVGDILWFSPLKVLQKLMFHTPIVYIFVFASALFHDKLWYPTKGKKIFNKWLKETDWGQLFQKY
ncbi:MAG: iron-sulfur cluster-binding protein [candidate division Zixibacteria bacterium 4484_95]|nr:MAG: iron-sulfur cluster-binding protein [candidate division Zixibacteria bacterium 4484_95]